MFSFLAGFLGCFLGWIDLPAIYLTAFPVDR